MSVGAGTGVSVGSEGSSVSVGTRLGVGGGVSVGRGVSVGKGVGGTGVQVSVGVTSGVGVSFGVEVKVGLGVLVGVGSGARAISELAEQPKVMAIATKGRINNRIDFVCTKTSNLWAQRRALYHIAQKRPKTGSTWIRGTNLHSPCRGRTLQKRMGML